MNTTIASMAMLMAVQSAFILTSPKQEEPYYLRGLIIVNMILIGLFAGRLFEMGGFTTNVGNVLFASVVAMQAVLVTSFGHEAGIKTLAIGARVLMLFALTSYVIAGFPIVNGNEVMAKAVNSIAGTSISVVTASFLAFVCGQYFFIKMLDVLEKWPIVIKYVVSMAALQVVDSLIFFPIAFGVETETIEIMITGFVFKVILGVLFIPVILLSNKQHARN